MYASESLTYTGGIVNDAVSHDTGTALALVNQSLPALLNDQIMTVRSAVNIHNLLRGFMRRHRGHQLPENIAEVTRNAAIRSVRDNDTFWAYPVVRDFHDVSAPLGLGMREESFVLQMEQTLLTRLEQDIASHSLHYTEQRIQGVQDSFRILGTAFTRAQANQVLEWVYDRALDAARRPGDDLSNCLDKADRIAIRLQPEHGLG